jgi:hypothetical protein
VSKTELNDDVFLQMVFQLGPWGKVLVMAIGAAMVMITLIIVVCFVGPGCWGYEWMHQGNYSNTRTIIVKGRVQ